MFGYYLNLALRSLRKHPVSSGLMVLAVALGIGTAMTMLAVLHNLSGDPLPQRSAVLYHPQVDPRPAGMPGADPEPPDDLTWQDAVNLFELQAASRRTISSRNWLPVRGDSDSAPLTMETTRAATADFFAMFDVPFLFGGNWSAQDDADRAHVVVLSRELNQRLFGGEDSIGRELTIATRRFRVAGVIDDWNPQPRFYDLNSAVFGEAERLLMPFFTWLDLPQDYGYGPMRCWGDDLRAGQHNPQTPNCTWVQFWVELGSPGQVAAYHDALTAYSEEQRALGRFERAPNVRLRRLVDWLDHKRVIPPTVRMQTWIAFGVLLVCLVNTVGLMLAKFLRKSGEIGIRRCLGASRRAIFVQYLIESGVVGTLGGLLGLPLAWSGLWLVRQQPMNYAALARMDMAMLATALTLAVAATLAAGLWPAWRASQVAPALQVKSL